MTTSRLYRVIGYGALCLRPAHLCSRRLYRVSAGWGSDPGCEDGVGEGPQITKPNGQSQVRSPIGRLQPDKRPVCGVRPCPTAGEGESTCSSSDPEADGLSDWPV